MKPKIFNSTSQILKAMSNSLHSNTKTYKAFFDSSLNGVITDPVLMRIPLDDHIVHRGHSVFDTLSVVNGRALHIDRHLQRLTLSAEMAKIQLPMPVSQLKEKLMGTIAVTGLQQCSARYFISSGPGTMSVWPIPGASVFYVMVLQSDLRIKHKGCREFTSSFYIKDSLVANIKSTNYLVNTLVAMESEAKGGKYGIQTTPNGYIAEGAVTNVAFVLPGKVFVTPKFQGILAGITIERILHHAEVLKEKGVVKEIQLRDIHIDEARQCEEMMMSSTESVKPVVEWDGVLIGGGEIGPVTLALQEALYEEMFSLDFSEAINY